METIPQAAAGILSHLHFYLDRISDEAYGEPLGLFSGASVGAHTRHILDGFLCLISGWDQGAVSYDHRERNPLLEKRTAEATRVLREILHFLNHAPADGPCVLTMRCGSENLHVHSTRYREIVHNTEHAIHHLALVKIALKSHFGWRDLPEAFGVAPSTLRYRQTSNGRS